MKDDAHAFPRWRLSTIGLTMLFGLLLLAGRLHRIQIQNSPYYSGAQHRQSIRRVLLPAPRGRIFDRNGICLADNLPSYCLAVYIEELRRPGRWDNTIDAVDRELDRLALRLGLVREIAREDIARHVRRRLPLPLLAWQGIDARVMARFAESTEPWPGFDIYVQPERHYPQDRLAVHLLGYVGRDRPVITNEFFHYDVMGMRGRAGMEAAFDDRLSGTPGGQLIRVDATGYKHAAWPGREAVPGKDLHLTIDAELQSMVERLLSGRRAACVILNPMNGDVLAMVSAPSFDPNVMSPSISSERWRALNRDPGRPLLNRAIAGVYPPGSIFKPLVALAALGHGIDPSFQYHCTGVFELGSMRLRCWSRFGHGTLTMRRALEQSCNPYFCHLGVTLGLDVIRATGMAVGLGRPTGIELPGESGGLLPSDAWKRRVQNDAWRSGDTANISIGQGPLLVTPLQMAQFAATLGNGGQVFKPRLVLDHDDNPVPLRHMNWSDDALETVRGGMLDVVQAPHGTGTRAAVPGLRMAGKTGTAEYGPVSRRRTHAWMMAFAPFDQPSVAMALVIEDGESGGRTAAPLVRKIMQHLFSSSTSPTESAVRPDRLEEDVGT